MGQFAPKRLGHFGRNTYTLLDVPISYFEYNFDWNTFGTVPRQKTTLRRIVTTVNYKSIIDRIRFQTDEADQNELKKKLPVITPVALLHHRKRDTSFAQKIIQQWPLLVGDIDKKDNPAVNMAELKNHIARLPYVLLCAYSVREGLWFVVRLPDYQTPESLAAHFRYLQKRFNELGVLLDSTKGGNPTDLRFVSYDADPYINENATSMSGTYTSPRPKSSHSFNVNRVSNQDEGKLIIRLTRILQDAVEGQRHNKLLRVATVAGGFVAAGRMNLQSAVAALENIVSEWPDFYKSQKTIRDGIRYGLKKPIY